MWRENYISSSEEDEDDDDGKAKNVQKNQGPEGKVDKEKQDGSSSDEGKK